MAFIQSSKMRVFLKQIRESLENDSKNSARSKWIQTIKELIPQKLITLKVQHQEIKSFTRLTNQVSSSITLL